eukprot:8291148-Pyramimonas_sp.AAC.1
MFPECSAPANNNHFCCWGRIEFVKWLNGVPLKGSTTDDSRLGRFFGVRKYFGGVEFSRGRAALQGLNVRVEPLTSTVEPLTSTVEPLTSTVEPLTST